MKIRFLERLILEHYAKGIREDIAKPDNKLEENCSYLYRRGSRFELEEMAECMTYGTLVY